MAETNNSRYLFRGKRADNGEWVEGDYAKFNDFGNISDCIKNGDIWYEVIPETVGQFTGLTDKNGTNIFEGDLLSCYDKDWDGLRPRVFGKLVFENGRFSLVTKRAVYLNDWQNAEVKRLIGNIHDNPELLTP